jgi:S-adenosylmethionine-diacylglycerol 3-amino-3-carboxypropyl transferase
MDQRPADETPPVPAVPYGGRLMFTQSWEDPACDLAALAPIEAGTLVSITSGGDNVLGFLMANPARIVTVDLNPAQSHLLELKMACFRKLTHAEMLEFLGVRPPLRARKLYQSLRRELGTAAQAYWDEHQEWLDQGLLLRGGFERYFAMIRGALRFIVGNRRMERLFTLRPEQQPAFFRHEWNTWRWRALVRIGCSRYVLGNRLDPSWFAHAEGVDSFGAHFSRLATHVIAELPAHTNYFLAQIFLGRYADEQQVPDYLRPEHFETIRSRLGRIKVVTADVADALEVLPAGSVDAFALSNVFEYSPPEIFNRAKRAVLRSARPGARVALRNLLAPRRLADDPAFTVDPGLSERLRHADRGFIYSRFEAATVL